MVDKLQTENYLKFFGIVTDGCPVSSAVFTLLKEQYKNILQFYDYIHILKNLRNNCLKGIKDIKNNIFFSLRFLTDLIFMDNIKISHKIFWVSDKQSTAPINKLLDDEIIKNLEKLNTKQHKVLSDYIKNMKNFHTIFECNYYNENFTNSVIDYFSNIQLTKQTKYQLNTTLKSIIEFKKIYPNFDLKIISTNPIEVFFSIIKSKLLYPSSKEYFYAVNNSWYITKLILTNKNINIPKEFVSHYYNINYLNIFDEFDIIEEETEIEKTNKTQPNKNQLELLNIHKPCSDEISIRDKSSSQEFVVLIPCPFISSTIDPCSHLEDFKSVVNLKNHLVQKHKVEHNKSLEISKSIYQYCFDKYVLEKNKFNNFSVLSNQECKNFLQKICPEQITDNLINLNDQLLNNNQNKINNTENKNLNELKNNCNNKQSEKIIEVVNSNEKQIELKNDQKKIEQENEQIENNMVNLTENEKNHEKNKIIQTENIIKNQITNSEKIGTENNTINENENNKIIISEKNKIIGTENNIINQTENNKIIGTENNIINQTQTENNSINENENNKINQIIISENNKIIGTENIIKNQITNSEKIGTENKSNNFSEKNKIIGTENNIINQNENNKINQNMNSGIKNKKTTKNNKNKNQTKNKKNQTKKKCLNINCNKTSPKKCDFCNNCCKEKFYTCPKYYHKRQIKNFNISNFTIFFHDFEFNSDKGILEYAIIKYKNSRNENNKIIFETEVVLNNHFIPHIGSFERKFKQQIDDISNQTRLNIGLLEIEIINQLKKLPNNIIFISHNSSVERNCIEKMLQFYNDNAQIADNSFFEKYYNNSTIDEEHKKLKIFLSNRKPLNFDSLLNKNIIYVDSIFLISEYKKFEKKNQEQIYKKLINENYFEKHHSLSDCQDLIKIFEVLFSQPETIKTFKSKNFLAESIENFLKKSSKGIFISFVN
jgi:hypothetical protein